MSLVVVGNTVKLGPNAGATANVGNVATNTNTFHVTNASSNVYAYVGVFSTYAEAAAMDYPTANHDGGGTILTPNESMTITGNFGPALLATQGNVYVAAITASGNTSVFFTPVAIGSTAN
jgi:hypothetical protein